MSDNVYAPVVTGLFDVIIFRWSNGTNGNCFYVAPPAMYLSGCDNIYYILNFNSKLHLPAGVPKYLQLSTKTIVCNFL